MLVGTASVEKSELLSKLLLRAGVPHEVLNAKNHAREAAIIAQAGRVRRGHRGHQHGRSRHRHHPGRQRRLHRRLRPAGAGAEPDRDSGGVRGGLAARRSRRRPRRTKAEAEKVREAGGLYVLGTERHESRRIDNQLRGRSGRQGDPGESRFYLSLGDDLMRRVGGGTVEMLMTRLRMPDDVPIEHNFVSKAIKSAQTQVEQQNFEIRKNVLKYDEVMNKQRTVIYEERRRVLDGEDLHLQVQNMITDVITAYVDGATAQGYAEDWDTDTLWTALKTLYPISVTPGRRSPAEHGDLTRDVAEGGRAGGRAARSGPNREETLTPPITRELERRVVLSVLDRKWREHLYEMDYLKEGIGLRAMAQRDPLVEYQREGFDMFAAMLDSLKEESVGFLYNLQVQVVPADAEQDGGAAAIDAGPDSTGANGRNGDTAPAIASGSSQNGQGGLPAPKPVGGKQAGAVRTRVRPVQPLPSQQVAAPVATNTDGAPAALRAKGLARPVAPAAALSYSGPQRRRRCGDVRRHRQAGSKWCAGPQRAVSVRIRQEVQAVPRASGRRLTRVVPRTRPRWSGPQVCGSRRVSSGLQRRDSPSAVDALDPKGECPDPVAAPEYDADLSSAVSRLADPDVEQVPRRRGPPVVPAGLRRRRAHSAP